MKIIDINSIPRDAELEELNDAQEQVMRALKYRKRRLKIIGILLASLPIIVSIWRVYQEKKDLEAQQDVFQAIYHFEAGDFDKALEGDGKNKGLLAILQQYPYTSTANLAYFYIGAAYMHQKAYDKAIDFLNKFHIKDFILQPRAWCVIGDAYSAQKNYKQAATYYMKAAYYKENSVYTPGYLIKAAIAHEADNRYKDAYHCYRQIIKKYPTVQCNTLATQEASRLSAIQKTSRL